MDENFIKKLFKKEYSLFKRIKKDYDLNDAYQLCIIYKQVREKSHSKWIKPLYYPLFLYILAWLSLTLLMWIMIPSIQHQLPNMEINFPSQFIMFVFGFQIGLILLLLIIKFNFKDTYYKRIYHLKNRFIQHFIQIYLSYFFLSSFISFKKKGISLIEYLDINRLNPNRFLGTICLDVYKNLKDGFNIEESFKVFDNNLIRMFSLERVDLNLNQLNHLLSLYETMLNQFFKIIKNSLLSISYLMIGLAVLLSYQIVLLPLKMVEELL